MVNRKRVLSLVLSYKLGGTAINSLRFIRNTHDKFEHFTIAHYLDNPKDRELREGYKKFTKKSFDVDTTRFKVSSVIEILKIVRQIKPDIIHVNGKGGALYGFFICLFYWRGFKLFYTMRGFHKKYSGIKHFLHMCFEFVFSLMVTNTIAVSDSERTYYLSETKASSKKTVVIPNGIEVIKEELPKSINNETRKYNVNIVSLSRINPQKDLITMLKAFERLDKEDISLHIIGGYLRDSLSDQKYERDVQKLLKTLNCKSRVYFWGDIPFAGNLIHNFDIYWSTAIFEGLPTAIVEAMMSKVLVVGTNCRGNVDMIKHGETGLMSKMGDEEDCFLKLKRGIQLIYQEEGWIMLENAYKLSQKYSIENNVSSICELYNS